MIAIMMCDDCDTQMEEVFTAQENFKLKGWMCPSCLHFAPAIGRERGFTIEDKAKTEDDRRAS
jgi:hypothetical protein